MLIQVLFESPQMFLIIAMSIVYALTVHEFAHALTATYLGDNTSKYSGRLSLNPLVHMDVFGTMMLLFAGFGWGKPVPVNTFNLRGGRLGRALVSFAGILFNFISVVLFIIILNILSGVVGPNNLVLSFLFYLIFINLILGVFNLIPIPPLDGSKILFAVLPDRFDDFKQKYSVNGPWLLLILLILDSFMGVNIFGRIFGFFIQIIEKFI